MAQAPSPQPGGDTDPSMDDILASIRRILSDEEKAAGKGASEGVLMLDPSMVVEDNMQQEPDAPSSSAPAPVPAMVPPAEIPPAPHPPHAVEHAPAHAADGLVAPAAAAAAASSVGTLMRTLVAERNAVVHRGGPSIEDLVREEIRPLLKEWLDMHLPTLVERLVRTEIERVVGRITG